MRRAGLLIGWRGAETGLKMSVASKHVGRAALSEWQGAKSTRMVGAGRGTFWRCHSQKDENVCDRAGEVRAGTGNGGVAGLGNVLSAELKEFGVILKLLRGL